jgi:lipoyl(octanoyl) transferase
MRVDDLGTMRYEPAWRMQEQAHEEVLNGLQERILLVEHPPVITLGRRADASVNLIASPEKLHSSHVEVVQSDRGGDITFHGPGQLVAYPIIRLNDHKLSVGGYVRRLEEAVVLTLREFGIEAGKDACAIGVWVGEKVGSGQWAVGSKEEASSSLPTAHCPPPALSKICAIGVRVRRGVTMHGLALNVTTNLDYFKMIVPCGLKDRGVTSMQEMLRDRTPSMNEVKSTLVRNLESRLRIDAPPIELLVVIPIVYP